MEPITTQPQNLNTPEILPPDKHFVNKKFILTFAVLALLGIVAYAGIWYWQKQSSSVPVSISTPRPSASVTPDATADWKTYTNAKYGFEFKYPQEGKIITSNPYSAVGVSFPSKSTFTFITAGFEGPSEEDMQSSVSVDGKSYTMWTHSYSGGVEYRVIIDSKRNIDFINTGGSIEDENLFNQILSTLKFVK